MITPRWVNTAAQPIAIEDVIEYLVAAAQLPVAGQPYVRDRRGRRHVLSRDHARIRPAAKTAPLDTARPISQSVAVQPLADADHASVREHRALPDRKRAESERGARIPTASRPSTIRPMGIARAIERALANEDQRAGGNPLVGCACAQPRRAQPEPARDLLTNEQSSPRAGCSALQAFAPIRRIGGRTGWYFGNVLWRIRGLIDLMMGGVGMRRGRPDPETPFPGTARWISGAWRSTSPDGGFACSRR